MTGASDCSTSLFLPAATAAWYCLLHILKVVAIFDANDVIRLTNIAGKLLFFQKLPGCNIVKVYPKIIVDLKCNHIAYDMLLLYLSHFALSSACKGILLDLYCDA